MEISRGGAGFVFIFYRVLPVFIVSEFLDLHHRCYSIIRVPTQILEVLKSSYLIFTDLRP